MPDLAQIENDIKKIEKTFRSFDMKGSREQILDNLTSFERSTSMYQDNPCTSVVIKWHRNIFLQETDYFPRAEEVLDEALGNIEKIADPFLMRWTLKIYLSLGYIHHVQCNYVDADFYLEEAVELALSDPSLCKYVGEIYALLADVNLNLNRYIQARNYVSLERDISYKRYQENLSDNSSAITYAYSLINFSRIKRLFGLVDHNLLQQLEEAVEIFSKLNYEKGLLKARLEQAELQYKMNLAENALETVMALEYDFIEKGMYQELMRTGLLTAKIYKTMLEYNRAEEKLKNLIVLVSERDMGQKPIMADVFFELGSVYYDTDRETKAFEYYRKAAKVGMIVGIKRIIVQTFNAAKLIDKYKARELLTSDLVYQDSKFVKDRLEGTINPFTTTKNHLKIFASTLFVDIVGFSGLMRKSQEDDTVKMIDELIDRLCLVIYQHHGYIDKFLGDGFMAIFEHGSALEPNVALNAIETAVDINRAINHKNRRLKKAYGVDSNIRVRMGLSTGEIFAIFLGNYIKREFTYMGNSVNLASKLESRAIDQLILIDENTNNLVKHRILADSKQIAIPGLGEITVYAVFQLARKKERQC